MTITDEQMSLAAQIWPGCKIDETVGLTSHAAPHAVLPAGIRLQVSDARGEPVAAVDAADSAGLTPKLNQLLRIANIKRKRDGINQHHQK